MAAVIPAQGTIPCVKLVVDGLKATTADCALLAPPMIEEVNKQPELLDFLVENLEFLFFAGGDVAKNHGDFVASRLPCFPAYAGTDIGLPPHLRTSVAWDAENWKHIEFHPEAGFEFRHSNDDVYEMVIVRKPKTQFPFTIFSDQKEYRNGDLFSPHPTRPNLWSYRGRSDDIVVFLTGEKTNPVSMEQHVARHPKVAAALVVGAQRFQASMILELSYPESESNPR